MPKVIVAGNIMCDHIKTIAYYPEKNMYTPILSLERGVGGVVCNTGISLKILFPHFDIYAQGLIGTDDDSKYIKETLIKYKIDVSGIKEKEGTCSFSDVMTEKETGLRTLFVNKGASPCLKESDLDVIPADLFHIGYLTFLDELDSEDEEYGTKMARLLHNIQKRGILTSIDVASEESDRYKKIVCPVLKYTDFVIINETEAGKITGINPRNKDESINIDNLKEIVTKLAQYGVKKRVVVHSPEVGICYNSETQNITIVPSLSLPKGYIKGTVGAGDAFCAGILGAYLDGRSDIDALRLASCVAASNLSQNDSISGICSATEALKLEKYGRIKL